MGTVPLEIQPWSTQTWSGQLASLTRMRPCSTRMVLEPPGAVLHREGVGGAHLVQRNFLHQLAVHQDAGHWGLGKVLGRKDRER